LFKAPAARAGDADEVANERCVPPVAAFVRRDASEFEQLFDLGSGKLEQLTVEVSLCGETVGAL
jgi:hypothetical protein